VGVGGKTQDAVIGPEAEFLGAHAGIAEKMVVGD
jgi:hypothetical protein